MKKAFGLGVLLLGAATASGWAGPAEDKLVDAVRANQHAAIKSLLAAHADPNMPLPAVPQQPGQHVQPAQYAPPGQPAQYTQPGQYAQPVQTAPYGGAGQPVRRTGMKRSAWGVWWLSYLTLGIYYLVWYYKVNEELSQFAPQEWG